MCSSSVCNAHTQELWFNMLVGRLCVIRTDSSQLSPGRNLSTDFFMYYVNAWACLVFLSVQVGTMAFQPAILAGGYVTDILLTMTFDGEAWGDAQIGDVVSAH